MKSKLILAVDALKSILLVGRGSSGRLILEAADEKRLVDAMTEIGEPVPYAWEVIQDGRTYLISAAEFTRNTYDRGVFKPLYE